ncbi:hypothetical protein [Phytoactinopolyspora limicola]|uniref:hypothetical protein n=1 Tax=Phytoactinopolyspora limicola TaxID=2715536 RepID=UPI001407EB69|nr:hypothetical protein [Phytoactinopolyspora limicola]
MMDRRIRRSAWAVLGVTGVMLAGCSGDDSGPSTGAQDESSDSPLAQYLGHTPFGNGIQGGFVSATSWEPSDEELQNERRVQELTAQCMRDEGFEYVPVTFDMESGSSIFDEAYALEPAEFAEKYGYGVSTLMNVDGGDESDDPNDAIRSDLSEAAQQAYDEALWGEMVTLFSPSDRETISDEDFDELNDVMSDPERQGCSGQAAHEVHGESFGSIDMVEDDDAGFNGLWDDLSALFNRVMGDPRVEDALDAWRTCMAEAGYPDFTAPDEAENDVWDRFMALTGGGGTGDDDDEATDSAVVVGTPDGNADIDPEALSELQDYEVELATAEFACSNEHYNDVLTEVSHQMEQEFVNANQAELERYRDWLAESGGNG